METLRKRRDDEKIERIVDEIVLRKSHDGRSACPLEATSSIQGREGLKTI